MAKPRRNSSTIALLMMFLLILWAGCISQCQITLCLKSSYEGRSLSHFLQKVTQARHLQHLHLVMSHHTRHHSQQHRTWGHILYPCASSWRPPLESPVIPAAAFLIDHSELNSMFRRNMTKEIHSSVKGGCLSLSVVIRLFLFQY